MGSGERGKGLSTELFRYSTFFIPNLLKNIGFVTLPAPFTASIAIFILSDLIASRST